jgi:hypothetical protein
MIYYCKEHVLENLAQSWYMPLFNRKMERTGDPIQKGVEA